VKILSLSITTLSKIRHVRIIDCTRFRFKDIAFGLSYFILHAPGLRLDMLTILDDDTAASFRHFEDYVQHSCGWRELRCVIDSSERLYALKYVPSSMIDHYSMVTYQSLMAMARSCSTSLAIFQAQDARDRGSIMHPSARHLLDGRLLEELDLDKSYKKKEPE
jgi:hypothetical protein